jgi:hypothetical protein
MISKRICSSCRTSATLNDKGEYSAISWKCPRCTKGFCRHVASYPVKKDRVCSECFIEHLDEQAIEKSA